MNEVTVVESTRVIDMVDLDKLENVMSRINQFQQLVQKNLKQDLDYGIIPGTKKPTLLKPGAEKILMLLGLRSEFEIVNETRDFERGFFQYQIKCKLYKGDMIITEGMGACNTKESKYKNSDGFSVDNTVLKMAKKRAMVDAALLVGSLSDLFTQDLEDMDLNGNKVSEQQKVATDQDGTISKAQAKRLFAISNGNPDVIKSILHKYGYSKSEDIKKLDYDKMCNDVDQFMKNNPQLGQDPTQQQP
jgi:hypothetical protein